MDDFHAGVTAVLRSWSALRTAVDSGWGGGPLESQGKAEDLRRNILHVMDGSKFPPRHLELDDLIDNLAIYLEEEFAVTLEDNSERQVAECIFKMYEDCLFKGDPSFARQMVAHAESAIQANSEYPVQVQTTEHDDDDDDEEMMDTTITAEQQQTPQSSRPTDMTPAEYAAAPLFGKKGPAEHLPVQPSRQLGETAPSAAPIEVDDDGFASVKSNRRK
jgi:pre-rRNA-processing protein TSR2